MGKLESQIRASLGRKYGYEGRQDRLLQQLLSGHKAHPHSQPHCHICPCASALRCPQILQAPDSPVSIIPTIPHGSATPQAWRAQELLHRYQPAVWPSPLTPHFHISGISTELSQAWAGCVPGLAPSPCTSSESPLSSAHFPSHSPWPPSLLSKGRHTFTSQTLPQHAGAQAAGTRATDPLPSWSNSPQNQQVLPSPAD